MIKRIRLRYLIPLGIILLMVLLNVAARLSTGFSDFYVMHIFPILSTPFAFISGIFPFSAGEVMIVLLLLIIALGIPALIVLLIIKKGRRRFIGGIAALTALWIFTYICVTETLNCFIMYQCTPFSGRYLSHREHTRSELVELYGILIEKSNELAVQVPRDEKGRFYITCDVDKEARSAMKRAAKDYPQLAGYYPKPKKIGFSYFMSQMGLTGIYFPFSMEANYNGDMVRTNLPDTLCHEYAHLKGVMQEDEANFIGFIASIGSDNAEFRYSGYLSALEYVHNTIYRRDISEGYSLTDDISDEVRADWFRFLPDDYWEKNKKKKIISTETVSTVTETALDTNIKMNGREEGTESYSHVVNLLLDYYFPA